MPIAGKMPYCCKETVEICKKGEGFSGCYFPATLLAAVGRNRYIVEYQTRFSVDKKRLVIEVVNADEVRPLPPASPVTDWSVGDRVDVYVDGAWRAGKVERKVDPNYHVLLDSNGKEVHCPFYKVRIHLDWRDQTWSLSAE